MLKRYVYDPTGRSPDNLIKNERHDIVIQDSGVSNGLYFPREGAYYADSITVVYEGRTLVKNEDWQYAFFWQSTTALTGQPVFNAIQLTNANLIGHIDITYQVVGGEYRGAVESINETIAKALPKENRNVHWDDVLDKPEAYIPTRHWHHIQDVFGLTPLVTVLQELREIIAHSNVLKLKTVYDRFLKLKQYVEGLLSEFDKKNVEVTKALDKLDSQLANLVTRDEVEIIVGEHVAEGLKAVNDTIDAVKETIALNKADAESKFNQVNEKVADNTRNIAETMKSVDEAKRLASEEIDRARNELNSRITEVESQSNNRDDALSREIERTFGINRDEIIRVREELETVIDDAVTVVNQNIITKVGEAEGRVNTKLNDQLGKIQENERAIAALGTTVANNKEELTNLITTTNGGVNEKIEEIKLAVGDNKALIGTNTQMLNDKIDGVKNTLTEKVDNHTTRLDGLDTTVANNAQEHRNAIAALDTAFEARITENERLNQVQVADIDKLKRDVETNKNDISEVNTKHDELQAELLGCYSRWIATKEYIDTVVDRAKEDTASVTERVNALESTVTPLTASVESNSNRITVLETELPKIDKKLLDGLTNLGSELDVAKEDIKSIKETNDSLAEAVNALDDRSSLSKDHIGILTGRVNTNEEEINVLKQYSDYVRDAVDNHIGQLANLTTQGDERYNELKAVTDDLAPKVAKNTANITSLTTVVAPLPDMVANNNNRLVTVERNIPELTKRVDGEIDTLKEKDVALKGEIDAANVILQNHTEQLANITKSKDAQGNQLIEVANNVDNLLTNTQLLTNRVGATETKQADLESRVTTLETNLPAEVTKLNENISKVDTLSKENKRRIDELNTTLADVPDTITNHVNRIVALEQAVPTLRTDLTNEIDAVKEKGNNHEQRITVLEGELPKYTKRLDDVNKELRSTRDLATDALSKGNSVEESLGATNDRINDAFSVIGEAKEKAQENSDSISEIERTMESKDHEYQDRYNQLDRKIDNNVKTLNDKDGVIEAKIATLNGVVTPFMQSTTQKQNELASNITKHAGQIGQLTTGLQNSNERISALESHKPIIENRLTTTEERLDALTPQMVSMLSQHTQLVNKQQFDKEKTDEELARLNGEIGRIDTRWLITDDRSKNALAQTNENLNKIAEVKDMATGLTNRMDNAEEGINAIGETTRDQGILLHATVAKLDDTTNKHNDLEKRHVQLRKEFDKLPVIKSIEIDLTSLNEAKYHPVEIHGLRTDYRSHLVIQYKKGSRAPWIKTEDSFMYLDWETLDERGVFYPNGREVEAFDYTALNVNAPPAMKLFQTQGIEVIYLRGGQVYNLDYKTFKDNQLSISIGAQNGVVNEVLDYNSEHDILTANTKLNKLAENEAKKREDEKQAILTEVDKKIASIGQIDPLAIRQSLKATIDELIAKNKEGNEEMPLDLAGLNIVPDEITEFTPITGMTVNHIIRMDGDYTDIGESRSVFTPGRRFEFEADGQFNIPEIYDGLLAQVILVTSFRPLRGNNSQQFNAIMSPSVKIGYVMLQGNTVVPITVGTITSFGKYFTNDGVDKRGLVQPSYPIFAPSNGVDVASEANILNLVGKHGKVVIFV